jgi:hypothetical protein
MSKVDKIKEKYKSIITNSIIEKFINGDTTPTKKYLDYMCVIWANSRLYAIGNPSRPMNAQSLINSVLSFDRLLPYIVNKDIYSKEYTDYEYLVRTVHMAQDIKNDKEFIREDHIEVIVDNDDYLLLIPKTHEGSLKYGANTKWCTASRINPRTFKQYTSNGYLFYLIRKNKKNTKWDKVAFYVKHAEALIDGFEIYSSDDIRARKRTIFKECDFELTSFMEIMMIINSNIFEKEFLKYTKEDVDNTITKLRSVDIDKTLKSISILNSYSESTLKTDLDSVIKTLTEKTKQWK